MKNNETIGIDYSDERLRILVEEYITQQRGEFTLKGVCSYVLYWAMEEGKAFPAEGGPYEGNKISQADCYRVRGVLEKIVREVRIAAIGGDDYRKL